MVNYFLIIMNLVIRNSEYVFNTVLLLLWNSSFSS